MLLEENGDGHGCGLARPAPTAGTLVIPGSRPTRNHPRRRLLRVQPTPEFLERLLLGSAALERFVELDDDELVIVRLARAEVAADAERIVIIVQNPDVFLVEKDNIFDRDKGEGEVLPDPDVTGLPGRRDEVRVGNTQEINREVFGHRGLGSSELDLIDGFEAVEIALGAIALDNEAMLGVGQNKVTDRHSARVQLISETLAGVTLGRKIELMDEERFGIIAHQRLFQ